MARPEPKARSKTYSMVKKATRPPDDEGGWFALTRELLESEAYRSLSINANRALSRILVEHISHAATQNGKLIVTHDDFLRYGVTSDLVADAIAELKFKGLIAYQRGRGGSGSPHPNKFRLTMTGDHNGLSATNEWKKIGADRMESWKHQRKILASRRSRPKHKKGKSPLGNLKGRPLGESLEQCGSSRKSPSEKPARQTPSTIYNLGGCTEYSEAAKGRRHPTAQGPTGASVKQTNNLGRQYERARSLIVDAMAEVPGSCQLTNPQIQTLASQQAKLQWNSEERKMAIEEMMEKQFPPA